MSAAVENSYWLPFTANRDFNKRPRVISGAEGHWYTTTDGTRLYDTFSGLWTSGLGHCHPRIVEAVQKQVATLDYCMGFQVTNNKALELAERATALAPDGISRCFFTNSGSESVDTALKIALGYHRARGEGNRTRLIGREKGYHGAGFGGTSVGGLGNNRRLYSMLLPGVDHLPHTHDLDHMAFSRGQPQWGAHLADALERRIALHGGESVAAVIVEPVAGSAGVIVPPVGYLQRLRELCTKHGILLIFDEVITGFGRLGENFGAQRFDVVPDMICCAKGITSGMIPMGAVLIREDIYDAFMQGPENAVELTHGYTYSGHPIAAAAALATLDVYEQEGLFENARALEPHFEARIHALRDKAPLTDIRNIGLMGALDLEPDPAGAGLRAIGVFERAFEAGVVVRMTGDTIALCPPLITKADELDAMFDGLECALAGI